MDHELHEKPRNPRNGFVPSVILREFRFQTLHPPSRKSYNFGSLSYRTIGACQDVQRQLGVHCIEVDYQRA
ncbi:MAG TPA: hypothetical protein PK530_04390 [Anaerolineales bacterium]|nr:hypothetical protein [Anaerolineales bacterium]